MSGGRWNPKGRRVVYCSDSLALACLEIAVHLGEQPVFPDVEFVSIELELPDEMIVQVPLSELPADWHRRLEVTQRLPLPWLDNNVSVALAVPSVLPDPEFPAGRNVLINPLHPDFDAVFERLPRTTMRFRLDERFFR